MTMTALCLRPPSVYAALLWCTPLMPRGSRFPSGRCRPNEEHIFGTKFCPRINRGPVEPIHNQSPLVLVSSSSFAYGGVCAMCIISNKTLRCVFSDEMSIYLTNTILTLSQPRAPRLQASTQTQSTSAHCQSHAPDTRGRRKRHISGCGEGHRHGGRGPLK